VSNLAHDDTISVPRRKSGPPPKVLLTLPVRMRYARERQGLTLTALAESTGMDLSQLSRLEKGERVAGVEAATVLRLASALNVPVGWLAADEGQLPPVPVFRETDRRRKPGGT
jgi:transcriptional regulator with XRE-family HTH domain